MLWFGRPWHAAVNAPKENEVSAPIGELCAWCEKPILYYCRGFLIPHVEASGETRLKPWHFECFARHLGLSPTIKTRDLEDIETVMVIAALELTSEPGEEFSERALLDQMKVVVGDSLEIQEQDALNVLRNHSGFRRHGGLVALK